MSRVNVAEKVFYIEATNPGWTDGRKGGSGVLLCCNQGNIIVTCRHVIEHEEKLATTVKVWPQGVGYTPNQAISVNINDAVLNANNRDANDLVLLNFQHDHVTPQGITLWSGGLQNEEVVTRVPVTIYGYPWGNKEIECFKNSIVDPALIEGSISPANKDGIHPFLGEPRAPGISGGPVFRDEILVGIFRGEFSPDGVYKKGVIIGRAWVEELLKKAKFQPGIQEEKTSSKIMQLTLSQIAELAQDCLINLPKERARFALMQINILPDAVPNANTNDLLSYYTELIRYLGTIGNLEQWLEKLAKDHLIFAKEWLQRIKGN